MVCDLELNDEKSSWRCVECSDTVFCGQHAMAHNQENRDHSITCHASFVDCTTTCKTHRQPLDFFCKTCNLRICSVCCDSGGHGDHEPIQTWEEIVSERHQLLEHKLTGIGEVIAGLEGSVTVVTNLEERLISEADDAKKSIEAAGKQVTDTVGACVKQLLQEVDDRKTTQDKLLNQAKDKLEQDLKCFKRTFAKAEKLKQDLDKAGSDFLDLFEAVSSATIRPSLASEQTVIPVFEPILFRRDAGFKVAHHLRRCVGRLTPSLASAAWSTLEDNSGPPKQVTQDEPADFALQIIATSGEPLSDAEDEVTAEWVETPGIATLPDVTVTHQDSGRYAVQFTPQETGSYSLRIRIKGQPVPGTAQCECLPRRHLFDLSECHSDISLSADRRQAHLLGSCRHCSVLGRRGTLRSTDEWTVQIGAKSDGYHIGVAAKPLTNREGNFEDRNVFCWQSSGLRIESGMPEFPDVRVGLELRPNDTLRLKLDCEKRTLTMINLRSRASDTIKGLPAVDLFPYFSLFTSSSLTGHSVQFLDSS